MDEYIKKIEEYILYREKIEYKKMLGYQLSNDDQRELELKKEEAVKARYYIEEENKRIKKLIKAIK